jgi:hypothetical protein
LAAAWDAMRWRPCRGGNRMGVDLVLGKG